MSRHFVRGMLFVAAALGLAGCATHEGPPTKAVKLAYVETLSGHEHLHWPKHHHNLVYAALEHTHVEKCSPTHKPDVWACSVYFETPSHKKHHQRVIDLMKEGTQWSLYRH